MMKQTTHTPNIMLSALPYVLAGIVFISLSFIHDAKSMEMHDCADLPKHAMHNGEPLPPPGMMGEHPHMDKHHSPFADLNLSDAQQKKIAEITQAQHNNICEKGKAVHETMQALHQLAASDQFDAAKARTLADAHGKAVAEISYLHAETQSKIWAILTPEQRKKLEEKREQMSRPH